MSVEGIMLTYHKTTEEEKYVITEWKYPGEYAVYDSTPYEEQKKRGFGFANPANHFYSFYDETALVGFINLYEEETEIFFGIGVNPDCCGCGAFGSCSLPDCSVPGLPGWMSTIRCLWQDARRRFGTWRSIRREASPEFI